MESSINSSMTSMDGGLDLQHCSGSRAKRSRHQIGCQSVYLELLHRTGYNLRILQKIGDKYTVYLMYVYKSIEMGTYVYIYVYMWSYISIHLEIMLYITNDGSTTSTTTHHQQEYIFFLS